MHIDTPETLHAQHDEGEAWTHNVLDQTILELLQGPFNDDNYRKWKVGPAIAEIESYLMAMDGTKYEKQAHRIIRKLKKMTTITEIILCLGEVILHD